MKLRTINDKINIAAAGLLFSLLWVPAAVSADAGSTTDTTTTPETTTSTTTTTKDNSSTDTTRISTIIARGDEEIQRRMNNLAGLETLINNATKLNNSADKTTLLNEVSSTVDGLGQLKTQLDAATTVSEAETDAQSIVTEYRVYVLVDPKIHLIKVADDQQVTESKLTTLAQKLQTRITAAQSAGQDVSSLTTDLASMNSSISAAQSISSSIETSVIGLQPTDYNSDHSVLEGDNTQLQTAQTDNQSAYNNATTIISALEAMKTTSGTSTSTNSSNTSN